MGIIRRVLQVLLVVAVIVLCYYLIVWILGLLGIVIPHQILVVIMVIIGLMAALGILSGRMDNIKWW